MRKLICALIGAAALVASAATYIQTSSTGTAPWKPVKDSVSQAHLADSALHAPPSAYSDSSRVSGLADSAKRAGWAPLDTGRVRGIVGDTATTLRTYIGSASTTGNAATATKLATARTITTSGDVTGTPTAFDGTANITIPTSFANAHLAGINQDLTTTSSPTFTTVTANLAGHASLDLPLTGGTMTAGAKILTLQDMTISTGANTNYSSAPFVAQRYTSDLTTTTHASIGFHNRGVNAAALFYHAGYSNFWYNDQNGGVYQLWSSKDFASQSITNWTTAYNWGNHASAGYLLSSTASSTYQPLENQRLSTSNSPTFGQLHIGSVDNPLIRLASDGSINVRANAGHEFVVATPTDQSSSDGLSLRFSGSEGNPVAIKATSFIGNASTASSIAWTGVTGRPTALSSFTNDSGYLTSNQSISLTGAVTGSGTTSIPTSFANTHLAGINQELTTTSSPTFGAASLGTWAGSPAFAWFGAAGQNNNTNGNSGFLQLNSGDVYMCAPSGHMVDIQYNSNGYLRVNSSGVSILNDAPLLAVSPPSTFTGLITANGGISGNLTGHASLDIPLTGSSAIAGSFAPATNQYYDFGAHSYQWNNVMAKTFVENGTSLSGLYASLNNDNTLVGQNDFVGMTITDGNLFIRGTVATFAAVWSTNTARTLDITNTNVNIYTVVTSTQQTLPNGLYNGQVIFLKNTTQTSISLNGSINAGSTFIQPYSMVMLVWDANNTRWF